ncbi:MAG: hypothetical protein SPK32_08905, partial [Bacteroidaceae bacterium]|nr:hypothetical protein [Bacteroidaceae bacterium]
KTNMRRCENCLATSLNAISSMSECSLRMFQVRSHQGVCDTPLRFSCGKHFVDALHVSENEYGTM